MNTGAGLRVEFIELIELIAEPFALVVLCSDPNLKTNDDDLFASDCGVAFSVVVVVVAGAV